jgi:hypothetical protein
MHFLTKPTDKETLRFFNQLNVNAGHGELKPITVWAEEQKQLLVRKLIAETDPKIADILRGAIWIFDDLEEVFKTSNQELQRRK